MENNKQEMIFVEGMNFKARAENAPETVRGGVYFKYPEFVRFMEKHKDEKGWVNVKMMKSKDKGTIYFILDTWKPKPSAELTLQTAQYNDNKYKSLDEVPTNKDIQNQREAQQVFGSPLTEEELVSLEDIPF